MSQMSMVAPHLVAAVANERRAGSERRAAVLQAWTIGRRGTDRY
jgi:hypothetical protein